MRRRNNPHTKWVRSDSNNQKHNKNQNVDDETIQTNEQNIKLRSSLDIYNRLINDNTLNINLNNVWIGYTKDMQNYQLPILDWVMVDKGGDIPMHRVINFVFYLNNGNKLILWDRKTQFDRLFCSGMTKQYQSLTTVLNSPKIQSIQSMNEEKKEETKEDDEAMSLCKFYGAGFCYRGLGCDSLHDGDKISKYEEQWLNGKIIVNKQCLPLISLDSTFSIQRIKKQKYDYILVLDLEGKDEIIELPCILIDLLLMKEVSRFHCWIRPTKWDKGDIPKYMQNNNAFVNIKSKAIPFGKALQLLSEWLFKFDIYLDKNGEYIKNPSTNKISKSFLSAICGNWDIKTQIPKQCKICNIKLPKYFNQWLNIKDFALNIYPHFQPYQVKGMFSLLKRLKMRLYGTHHLGMDDTYNIARIIMKFAMNNAIFDCTAYRDNYTQKVIYKNNNRRVSPYHTSKRSQNNYFQYKR